jgi:hypothetical protein
MPEIENIEEENLKEQITNSNAEIVNENISQEQIIETIRHETQNLPAIQPGSQLQSEIMEVHKHPHHVMHKKKWGEYLLEFLMLFLAVFLGFVAENIRDEYAEHQRARQYASTMLQDLRADKEALEAGIRTNNIIKLKIDTLLQLYHSGETQTTTGMLYYYGRSGFRFWHYVNKQVTLEQMKYSGTIRYFNNSFLENKLVALDKQISFIQYWEGREAIFEAKGIQFAEQLFNYDILETIPGDSATPELAEYHGTKEIKSYDLHANPGLLNNDPRLIKEYLNYCFQRLRVLDSKLGVYQDALAEMESLMITLKKEYHLE